MIDDDRNRPSTRRPGITWPVLVGAGGIAVVAAASIAIVAISPWSSDVDRDGLQPAAQGQLSRLFWAADNHVQAFDASTGLLATIPSTQAASSPSISPDGTHVAFAAPGQEGNSDLFTVAVDGSQLRQLTNTGASETDPEWSPDDATLAFQRIDSTGVSEIAIMSSLSTETPRVLLSSEDLNVQPTWSPDGTKLAFTRNIAGNVDIWTIDVQTGELRNVTDSPNDESSPAWSWDGESIAFILMETSPEGTELRDIWQIDQHGGDSLPVVETPNELEFSPMWTPEGEVMYITAGNGSPEKLRRTSGGRVSQEVLAERVGATFDGEFK